MYWFPIVKYKIITKKNHAQIREQFINKVYLVNEFSSYKINTFKDFEGIQTSNGFKLKKANKEGISSLSPIAYCKYYEFEKQSYIKVFIRFKRGLNFFLFYMFLFTIIFSFIDIILLCLSIGFYGIIIMFFNKEAYSLIKKTKVMFN